MQRSPTSTPVSVGYLALLEVGLGEPTFHRACAHRSVRGWGMGGGKDSVPRVSRDNVGHLPLQALGRLIGSGGEGAEPPSAVANGRPICKYEGGATRSAEERGLGRGGLAANGSAAPGSAQGLQVRLPASRAVPPGRDRVVGAAGKRVPELSPWPRRPLLPHGHSAVPHDALRGASRSPLRSSSLLSPPRFLESSAPGDLSLR